MKVCLAFCIGARIFLAFGPQDVSCMCSHFWCVVWQVTQDSGEWIVVHCRVPFWALLFPSISINSPKLHRKLRFFARPKSFGARPKSFGAPNLSSAPEITHTHTLAHTHTHLHTHTHTCTHTCTHTHLHTHTP